MEDKLRILKMLEDGKITSEEASKLLSALEGNKEADEKLLNTQKEDDKDFFNITKTNSGVKMLYIRIISADGEKVKVTLPVEIVKLMTSIGTTNIAQLEKHNINFDLILESIEKDIVGPIVQVDTDEGDKILIEIA